MYCFSENNIKNWYNFFTADVFVYYLLIKIHKLKQTVCLNIYTLFSKEQIILIKKLINDTLTKNIYFHLYYLARYIEKKLSMFHKIALFRKYYLYTLKLSRYKYLKYMV